MKPHCIDPSWLEGMKAIKPVPKPVPKSINNSGQSAVYDLVRSFVAQEMDLLESLSKDDPAVGVCDWLWGQEVSNEDSFASRLHRFASRFTTHGSSGQRLGAAHAFEWIAYLIQQAQEQFDKAIEDCK